MGGWGSQKAEEYPSWEGGGEKQLEGEFKFVTNYGLLIDLCMSVSLIDDKTILDFSRLTDRLTDQKH